MNMMLNKQKQDTHLINSLVTVTLALCILVISISSYAGAPPPNLNQCKTKWVINNITTGMQFGDFALNSASSGTITLNTGSTRSESTSIDLISAGSVVSTHQLVIDNTLAQSATCAGYGIDIAWVSNPDGSNMTGPAPGPGIGISAVKVYIEGVETALPTGNVTTYTLPLNLEITSRMTTSTSQTSGLYTSPVYEIGLTPLTGAIISTTGTATTTAYKPISVTKGATMDFGTIAAGSNETVVSVDASGFVTAPAGSGNAVVTISAGAALTFIINGENGLSYNLTVSDAVLDDGSVGAPMAVTITGDDRPVTLNGADQTVTVTADLTVGASQEKGTYTTVQGSPIVITINYN